MQDLFTENAPPAPLAHLLRPTRIEDIAGQSHLLGEGKPLNLLLKAGTPRSIVLWGPAGTGKTTIATLVANHWNAEFKELSAVQDGTKEFKEAFDWAVQVRKLHGKAAVIFIDEFHRCNRAVQDLFLPGMERGTFTVIAATTESPNHAITGAFLSRARVFRLSPLSDQDLDNIVTKALNALDNKVSFLPEARVALISRSQGDARSLIDGVAQVTEGAAVSGISVISEEYLDSVTGDTLIKFGKQETYFYDTISALHKSVRGSDPDAALYWLARMLRGGADPMYLWRRLLVIASEDIGLADSNAINVVASATAAFERVGLPEGGIILAHAVNYLALAPKSNHSYKAWRAVNAYLDRNPHGEVPSHLEDAAKNYRYPHNEPGAFAPGQAYLPESVGREFWLMPEKHTDIAPQKAYSLLKEAQPPLMTLAEVTERLELYRRANFGN